MIYIDYRGKGLKRQAVSRPFWAGDSVLYFGSLNGQQHLCHASFASLVFQEKLEQERAAAVRCKGTVLQTFAEENHSWFPIFCFWNKSYQRSIIIL